VLLDVGPVGRGSDDDVTRPFSLAYKQKMLDRLTGKDAVSARQLSLETGLRKQTLSRWLQDACTLSVMAPKRQTRAWSIDRKVQILAEADNVRNCRPESARRHYVDIPLTAWAHKRSSHDPGGTGSYVR
jgi:hypothetical protein